MAGSTQDKNNHYTFVKYGKSGDGYLEFTRTGTKIEGYVEMASINQKNEVEIKKYQFNGTLVNHYISITFPGEAWLNSSKGITWIGNFDYQETSFYAPIDASIDANGYTELPFSKGTIDGFNSFVSELKGRAQEWKRETEQMTKQQSQDKNTKNQDDSTNLAGINDDINTKVFTSEKLHATLRFNKNWQPPSSPYATDGRFEGSDGFFEVTCTTGEGKTIDAFVTASIENFKSTHIIGTQPKVTSLKIENQPSRLIMPSNDQPIENKNEAILYVKYPSNITIKSRGHIFDYFTLFADKNNIMTIAKTIKFKL